MPREQEPICHALLVHSCCYGNSGIYSSRFLTSRIRSLHLTYSYISATCEFRHFITRILYASTLTSKLTRFSAIALARMLAMTFLDLAKITTYSYDPNHNVMKLLRTINIQAWLQGTSERHVHVIGVTLQKLNSFLLRCALV